MDQQFVCVEEEIDVFHGEAWNRVARAKPRWLEDMLSRYQPDWEVERATRPLAQAAFAPTVENLVSFSRRHAYVGMRMSDTPRRR